MRMLLRFIVLAAGLVLASAGARGFTLLDFRPQGDILNGLWFDWLNTRTEAPLCPGGKGLPFTLTYRIDANFMSNAPANVRAGAAQAVRNALATWSLGTGGFISFREADWAPVVNADTTPRLYFEGPPLAEWQACTQGASPPGCVTCWPDTPACPDVLPGWGANIDFFTRPTGWTLRSNGFNYQMTSNLLGFTTVHRRSDGILSIDIYLNSAYQWTNDANSAQRVPLGLPMPGCSGVNPAPAAPLSDALEQAFEAVRATTVFDIESVVLHELGHAFGLDHPDQACARGGAQINARTHAFDPCASVQPGAVMLASYNGVVRELSDDELGGIAFLYRPRLAGDFDGDDEITVSDAARALDLIEDAAAPDAYSLAVGDVLTRNGRIDLDEVQQILSWALNPGAGSPGRIERDEEGIKSSPPAPSAVTVRATASPDDAGLGPTLDVTVRIENPNLVRFTAWDIDIVYNATILRNPRLTLNGSFLAGGSWSPLGPDDGSVRFAKIAFGSFDASPSGTLGTITFDVDASAAWSGPPAVSVSLTDAQLVTDMPYIHNYGSVAGLPESLTLQSATVPLGRYDADGDRALTVRDLYAYEAQPFDVDKDGVTNLEDRAQLVDALRRNEEADALAAR
ncbi:MAG: hypothetical protein SFZ24_04970 [Planctomycetota bacterium]|nr:hypothetical protein [Planctomycetota bacterium]